MSRGRNDDGVGIEPRRQARIRTLGWREQLKNLRDLQG
jgi:hypothetical protein